MPDTLSKLTSLGLSEQKAKETIKNESLTTNLLAAIEEAKKFGGVPSGKCSLLYHTVSKLKPQILHHLPLIVQYIVENKIDSIARADAALEFLLSNAHKELDIKKFEAECGIGISVTPEDIELAVENAINKSKKEILDKRYRFNSGILLQQVRNTLKWADFRDVKNEIDVQLLYLLGPKTEEDLASPDTKNKKKEKDKNDTKKIKAQDSGLSKNEAITVKDMIAKLTLHEVGKNFTTDGYVITSNTQKHLTRHMEATKGCVLTRFPPEPNGILHIGHAKAININFGYAKFNGGSCILRFDDTNPEKEEERFIHGIIEIVKWLGYHPSRITYSSDYFDKLYFWAKILIGIGQAYVCHQKQEEIKGFNPPPSPWRNRSIEENFMLFDDMKNGKMEEGECTLRMKVTLEEGKQDPVAYRIKYQHHVRTGNEWCIYPTYDYTHCLCDSIENITHSLCTKEFQSRRSAYYWLCNTLDIYCPVQWEYGRLNMNYTVVSKRKIAKLIEEGIVADWDDPRLFTLSALRRRGFPPEAINNFCARLGVTGAQTVVDPSMLEACVRDVLNDTAPRTMVVIEPLLIEITEGLEEDQLSVPNFPADPSKGTHQIKLCNRIYIEKSDFRDDAEPGYKRLSFNQPVGLRYTPYIIRVVEAIYDDTVKNMLKLIVRAEVTSKENKPKAFIHWVSDPSEITVRLYNNLFKHKNPEDPEEVPGGFLSDITENSLVEKKAYCDNYLIKLAKHFTQFQFERIGYFSVDPDSNGSNILFNRTVSLKEDSGKN
ncbi:probable glutamine--tRNA ligase [Halyomorpha halys]|uniref:probable glutamine--tRNA ligase n=1 Tax=Halyomorpha halys TaxID=286706 RepID=UPI0006D51A00|nr:probable glutamine--tRNA ligase [Halyomorpha halys]